MQGNTPQVKVVLLGDSGVGKSSFMLRFVKNNFKIESKSTIGASYMGKILQFKDRSIKFNIWDTAGQERYHSLAKMYLQDANSAILIYDITDKSTFESLKRWHHELIEVAGDNIVIAICGNKEDLIANEDVSPEEARMFAKSIGAIYRKISAKTNLGIEATFTEIANRIFSAGEVYESRGTTLQKKQPKTNKKKCC
jgi:small GTP-binding protein